MKVQDTNIFGTPKKRIETFSKKHTVFFSKLQTITAQGIKFNRIVAVPARLMAGGSHHRPVGVSASSELAPISSCGGGALRLSDGGVIDGS
jgi:hypothetical protein